MLYKKILVPFDGSDPAKNALTVAKKMIADDAEATLCVLSVVPANAIAAELESPTNPVAGTPLLFPDVDSYERVIANAKTRAEERLREGVGDALDGASFDVRFCVTIAGKTAEGIVDFAEEQQAEIIVMGRRGLGALRGMLGSVSYAVLHEADIPVLTVK
ncbi:universal stress protein [Adlercreutzia sp. ZJ242]|uniref:universal stress protein n=1 Tax=Adlercreutzia sp. ZJ242 TaxID=2709409 RepID=UPI0013EA01A7|nr:universal stress protein [Adlercreutzia sp. ZJ242]